MRIGVISDTHGYLDEQVFTHFKNCDEIWHAGDIGDVAIIKKLRSFKPLRVVYGNIDGISVRQECSEDLHFTCGGLHILLTHIAGKPPSFNGRIRTLLWQKKPDILVCGHSHILSVLKWRSLFYLNPGASGFYGSHRVRTLLRFEIENKKLSGMEIIELGVGGTY